MDFEQALCAFLEKKDCEQAKGELLSFGRAAFRAGWLAARGGQREIGASGGDFCGGGVPPNDTRRGG